MPANCSAYSSGCIARTNSKGPASAWRMLSASLRGTAAPFGRKRPWTAARRFISVYRIHRPRRTSVRTGITSLRALEKFAGRLVELQVVDVLPQALVGILLHDSLK